VACVGLAIAVSYLLLHTAFDALFLQVWRFSPAELPWWQADDWWSDCLNGVLIGYLPAAQAIARGGVARDLVELRPRLRFNDTEFSELTDDVTGPGRPLARLLALSGLVLGAWLAFGDPSMRGGAAISLSNPVFVWHLSRSMLVVWLVMRFSVYDFTLTRAYLRLGRNSVAIDLLDIGSLTPFARRGQRSALAWVLLSSLVSLFWLGETAASVNLPGLVLVLPMATFAFLGPLAALRRGIQAEKHAELGRLREQIRDARSQTGGAVESPRLANLIAYYQLIESAREWPVDAANLLKFVGYLLLGLGSWLGAAVVERILDSTVLG
jgi:hypothetical protein